MNTIWCHVAATIFSKVLFPDCFTFLVLGLVVTCGAYMRGRTGDPFTNMV